ncbi:metallophosphoesterase [Candidatus Saccharibacteria bacterium]|nr:metallophosphoesterase [Candidatus Saccharibacteria bacterium]
MRVRVNHFRLASPKVARPAKILVMSDVHNNHEVFAGMLKRAEKEAPNYICLAGDTLDRTDCDVAGLVGWIESLSKIATVVIGLGNHELGGCGILARSRKGYGENLDFYAAVDKIKNCALLNETFETFSPENWLTFGAVNMPKEWYSGVARESQAEFRKVLETVPAKALEADRFNVLISHSPNGWLTRGRLISWKEAPILKKLDLILSGHNHGGLVPRVLRPIMMNRGFIGPKYKMWQPHAFGHWTDGRTSLVLSNGVTKFAETSGFSAAGRFLNKFWISEIEIIELVPAEKYQLTKC